MTNSRVKAEKTRDESGTSDRIGKEERTQNRCGLVPAKGANLGTLLIKTVGII